MPIDEISRNKVPKKLRRNGNHSGTILCIMSALLLLGTAIDGTNFATNSIYGVFGWYCYIGFIALFALGLLIALRKKIKVKRRFVVFGGLMTFALFTALHIAFTHAALGSSDTSFTSYIMRGFDGSTRTPGGLIFALPSFALHAVCQLAGSLILLAVLFIICGALIATHVVSTSGGKTAVSLVENQFEIEEKTQKKKSSEEYKKNSKELQATLDTKYQEMLHKQSAKRLSAGKSELGLTNPPSSSAPNAIYDNPVPLGELQPGRTSAPEEITRISTEAAQKFSAGLGQTFGQESFGQSTAFGQTTAFGQQFGGQPAVSFNQGQAFQQPFNPQPSFGSQSFGASVEQSAAANAGQDRINRRLERAKQRMSGSLDDRINRRSEQMSMEVKQSPTQPYRPRQYNKPPISLIRSESSNLSEFHQDALEKQNLLDVKLNEFGVNAKVTGFTVAPAVTRFEIQLATGTGVGEVEKLSKDISYALGGAQIRLELVEGKNAIGIEVPNKSVGLVSIKDILSSREFQAGKSQLTVAIGKNLSDDVVLGDISTMPHLLIAGSTGSGKSVCLNTILTSLVFKAHPDEVKLLLVDMKRIELNTYNEIPHMLIPRAIKELQQVINALKWMEHEMRRRYDVLESQGVNNIALYHSLPAYQNGTLQRMPYIVMVIDEAADLLTRGKKEVEASIQSLSSLARACGIHIILATQRPSVDVITGVIKTNLTVRIAFKVLNRHDSVTIIDDGGAEKLVGRGDMLFVKESKSQRVQCAFIELDEARKVMNFIRENNTAEFDAELEDIILNGLPDKNSNGGNAAMGFGDADFVRGKAGQDPLFIQILKWLVRDENVTRTASISNIQRNFNVGFARAGRIIDQLADAGYITSGGGTKARNVLVTRDEVDEAYGE